MGLGNLFPLADTNPEEARKLVSRYARLLEQEQLKAIYAHEPVLVVPDHR